MTEHQTTPWDQAGNAADAAVRKVLGPLAQKHIKRTGEGAMVHAVALGGIKAAGELLRASTIPEGRVLLEEMAVAYLRGALRGAGGPIHEDGREWEGVSRA